MPPNVLDERLNSATGKTSRKSSSYRCLIVLRFRCSKMAPSITIRNGKTMPVQQTLRRSAAILLAALAFGVAIAVLKGGDAGLRDAIGNISAPWLLLPYLAGTVSRGPIRGALLGAATCLAALAGFYVAEAFVLDLGGHPLLTNLTLTLGAGRYYFAAGVFTGPLFGALGGINT